MAIPIKYSTTAVDNTIKTNNIVLGTKTTDYGPTSSSGFYVGIDPPTSGYTIYQVFGEGQQPKAVCADTDDDVIYFARSFGGIDINTIGEAINYFLTGSTGTTIVNMGYPNIITSGLILCFDASFIPSYPRTGEMWKDLSGNNNDGTLINDPIYNSNNGGSFRFNGSTNHATVSSFPFLSGYTIMAWANPVTIISDLYNTMVAKGSTFEVNTNYSFSLRNRGGLGEWHLCLWWNNGNSGIEWEMASSPINNWWCYAATRNNDLYSGYTNGSLLSQHVGGSVTPAPTDGGQPLTIAKPNSTAHGSDKRFDGYIRNVLIYNRPLSSAEIIQNYQAVVISDNITKDGLVLYLDPGNIYSYNTIGSTIYDLSGNGYNGSIIGTLPYSDDGGYFNFLSTDNGITFPTSCSKLFPGINNYTWCGWLKFSGYTGNWRDVWYGNAGGGHKGFGFALKSSENNIRVTVYGSNNIQQSLEFSVSGYLNAWHYFTIVLDRSDFSAIIYIDSTYQTTLNFADWASLDGSGYPFIIGYHFSVGTWQYDGSMGPVHIYQKALSSTEITQNYNALKDRFGL